MAYDRYVGWGYTGSWGDLYQQMKKLAAVVFAFLINMSCAFAANNVASVDFSIQISPYVKVEPVTSPVLTAHITNRTGNLYAPLSTTFRVITNKAEDTKLYLNAHTVTQGGYEEAMFERAGRVYIAFSNIAHPPKSQSLSNCKLGSLPKESPGVVAYPITSVTGADSRYLRDKNKYEVTASNGTSLVTVNVGQNVLQTSFAANDPRGFYQAVLSLTEADI